jgi:hypothetical protein
MFDYSKAKQVRCIRESVYEQNLTYGEVYEVLDYEPEKRQLKVRTSRGKKCFHQGCFGPVDEDVPRIHHWNLDDPVDEPYVEVSLELEDGSKRWCIFATPEHLASIGDFLDEEQQVRWHPPCAHMFVMSKISEPLIERALREVERQGDLLATTRPLMDL